jgi:RNA polymerase sigma factor (TIGR02999 family)
VAGGASITERLQLFMQGDRTVADELLTEVMPKLREIALRALNRERYRAPLSRTELIQELWVGSLSGGGWQVRDQGHFYALASLAMRRILVDDARRRLAARRGGRNTRVPLDEIGPVPTPEQDAEQIVEIGMLMERLDSRDPDAARLVDMHYFSGFTLEEIAAETGLTVKQIRRRWDRGLKWLQKALGANRASSAKASGSL